MRAARECGGRNGPCFASAFVQVDQHRHIRDGFRADGGILARCGCALVHILASFPGTRPAGVTHASVFSSRHVDTRGAEVESRASRWFCTVILLSGAKLNAVCALFTLPAMLAVAPVGERLINAQCRILAR